MPLYTVLHSGAHVRVEDGLHITSYKDFKGPRSEGRKSRRKCMSAPGPHMRRMPCQALSVRKPTFKSLHLCTPAYIGAYLHAHVRGCYCFHPSLRLLSLKQTAENLTIASCTCIPSSYNVVDNHSVRNNDQDLTAHLRFRYMNWSLLLIVLSYIVQGGRSEYHAESWWDTRAPA